jgi:hypothetical protein
MYLSLQSFEIKATDFINFYVLEECTHFICILYNSKPLLCYAMVQQ